MNVDINGDDFSFEEEELNIEERIGRVDATIDEIPKWLHDNEYINTGYRMD